MWRVFLDRLCCHTMTNKVSRKSDHIEPFIFVYNSPEDTKKLYHCALSSGGFLRLSSIRGSCSFHKPEFWSNSAMQISHGQRLLLS